MALEAVRRYGRDIKADDDDSEGGGAKGRADDDDTNWKTKKAKENPARGTKTKSGTVSDSKS